MAPPFLEIGLRNWYVVMQELDALMFRAQREGMNIRKSALEDPDYAAFAWGRYKRLMWWMVLASLIATLLGLGGLYVLLDDVPIPMLIATAAGVFFSVLLAAALMGLVFLSSGTGHDEVIEDPFEDEA
jgi:hypothetical protein